jgi:flagellar hook-length control protein FliK
MDVRLQGQKVEVIMVTAEAEVPQALQSHADQIKSAFQAQGIQVDSYEVLCFSDSDPRSFKENAFKGGGRGDSESGQSLGGESSPEISRKTIQIIDDSGISVFA